MFGIKTKRKNKGARGFSLTRFFLLSFFFGCLCLPAFSQDAAQPKSTMQTLSQEIHRQLDDLRQQSRDLTEQLILAENELEMSSKQVEALKMELSDLNTYLTVTNERLSSYSEKLNEYERKLKTRAKIIAWCFAFIVLFVLVRVATLVLKWKGINLPEWLDEIL